MIIELSINGARVIVSGENLSVSMTEESALDAVKVTTPKSSAPKASQPETSDFVITPEHVSPAVPTAKATAGAGSSTAPATPRKTLSAVEQTLLLRPNCKHADDLSKCGGSGRNHCQACKAQIPMGGVA